MKKRFSAIAALMLCVSLFGCATSSVKPSQPHPQVYPLDAAVQALADGLVTSFGDRQAGKITVADLIGPGEAITGLGEYIAEKISVRLFGSGRFPEFMERRQLKQMVAALKMEKSGYFDQETVSKFGKMIGVESMVIGTVTDLGAYYDVLIKIVQSETGAILAMAEGSTAKDETTARLMIMQRTATLTVIVDPPVQGQVVAGGQQASLRNGMAIFVGIPYGECTVVISPEGHETVRRSISIRSSTEVLSETLQAREYEEYRAVGTASISYQCDPKTENPCPPHTELRRRAIEVAKIHALQALSQRLGVDVNALSNAVSGRLAAEKVTTRSGAVLTGIHFSEPIINGDELSVEIIAKPK